jgi:hypothetical protein
MAENTPGEDFDEDEGEEQSPPFSMDVTADLSPAPIIDVVANAIDGVGQMAPIAPIADVAGTAAGEVVGGLAEGVASGVADGCSGFSCSIVVLLALALSAGSAVAAYFSN